MSTLEIIAEALERAKDNETVIAEKLAHCILERDHPQVIRRGTFEFLAVEMRNRLAEAERTTDALERAFTREKQKETARG